jgi:hypothetical protein
VSRYQFLTENCDAKNIQKFFGIFSDIKFILVRLHLFLALRWSTPQFYNTKKNHSMDLIKNLLQLMEGIYEYLTLILKITFIKSPYELLKEGPVVGPIDESAFCILTANMSQG